MDSFRNLEDETFPSFNMSLGSSGRVTLGDVTLGSTLGVPMAASTVAKSRATADNRCETLVCMFTVLHNCETCYCSSLTHGKMTITYETIWKHGDSPASQ